MGLSRRQKWLARIPVCTVCVVLVGYFLLPWWLPTESIRTSLVERMERELGRDVSIGELKLSWNEGIEIGQLAIKRRGGFGEGNLLEVKHISLPFAPIGLIFGQVAYLHVTGAEAYLVAHEGGKINIEDLLGCDSGADPISLDEVQLTDVSCHLLSTVDGRQEGSVLEIEGAQFRRDSAGDVSWVVRGRQGDDETASILSEGQIKHDNAQGNIPDKEQYARLTIRQLDLHRLKMSHWMGLIDTVTEGPARLPLEQLAGKFSLDAALAVGQDGKLRVEGWFELGELKAARQEKVLVDRATVRGTVAMGWDPGTLVVALEEAEFTLRGEQGEDQPALKMALTGGYDPRPGADEALAISVRRGRCDPAAILRLMPALAQNDALLQQALTSEGLITFTGEFRSNERGDSSEVSIDGADWQVDSTGVHKDRGEPATLLLRSEFDRASGRLNIDPVRLEWTSLVGQAKVTIPDRYEIDAIEDLGDYAKQLAQAARVLVAQRRSLGVDLQVAIGDFDDLEASVKYLFDGVRGVDLSGPVEMELHIGTPAEASQMRQVQAKLHLSKQTQFALEGYHEDQSAKVLAKGKGQSLTVELVCQVDSEEPRLHEVSFKAALGSQAHLAFGPAWLMWPSDEAQQNELTAAGEWKLAGIEHWLEILPRWRQTLQREGISMTGQCAGKVSLVHESDAGWSAKAEGELTDFGLAVVYRKDKTVAPHTLAQKPVGQTMEFKLKAQEWQEEHRLDYAFESSLGQGWLAMSGEAWRLPAEGTAGRVRLRKLLLDARSDDLEQLRDYLPGLFEADGTMIVGPYRVNGLSGGIGLKAAAHVAELGASVQFEVTGDDAALYLSKAEPDRLAIGLADALTPGESFTWKKTPDVELRLWGEVNLKKRNNALNGMLLGMMGKTDPIEIEVTELGARAGGSWMKLTGDMVVNEGVRRKGWSHWLEVLQQAEFALDGSINYGQLNGANRDWRLAGKTQMTGQFTWQEDQDRLECRVDLDMTDTTLHSEAVGRDNATGQEFQLTLEKPSGDDLTVSLAVEGGMAHPDVRLKQLELVCPAGTLRCEGNLEEATVGDFLEGQAAWPGQAAELQIDLNMAELGSLQRWMPQLQRWEPQGRLAVTANASVQFEPSVVAYLQDSRIDLQVSGMVADAP